MRIFVRKSKDSTIKDTFEIYQTDNVKVTKDGSWVEITKNGREVFSGNTTARTAKEAYELAQKEHLLDSAVNDADYSLDELRKMRIGNYNGVDIYKVDGKFSTNPNTSHSRFNTLDEVKKYIENGFKDSAICLDGSNKEEFKKEFAKWQNLYMKEKLITSDELQKKYYELKKKYNISDSDADLKPEFPAKGIWEYDDIVGDWYDTGAKMYYTELRRLNGFTDKSVKNVGLNDTKQIMFYSGKEKMNQAGFVVPDGWIKEAKLGIWYAHTEERGDFGQFNSQEGAERAMENLGYKKGSSVHEYYFSNIDSATVNDSIMQEYEDFKSRLGTEKAKALDKYLNTHNDISYSDILYKKAEYDKFENWYSKGMKDASIDKNKIEQIISSREFSFVKEDGHTQTYKFIGQNPYDKEYHFKELVKVIPNSVGLGLSGDFLEVSYRDSAIKDYKSNVNRSSSFKIIEKLPNGYGIAQTYGDDLYYVFDKNGDVKEGSYWDKSEAIEAAKRMRDSAINDTDNRIFELGNKRQVVFGTGNFVAMENGEVYDKGFLGGSRYNGGKGWNVDEYIDHLKSLGYREVRDNCIKDFNPNKDAFYATNSRRFNQIKNKINSGELTKESALQYIEKMWGSKEPGSASYLKEWLNDTIRDSVIKDSNKLLQMAYKLAQMSSYFDRANTPRSRKLLSQEDETKKAELFSYGNEVLNQLNQEVDNMKRAGVNNNSPFAETTKIADLLVEAGDGMYWIGDTKLQILGKKLKSSANEYDGLAKKYGQHRRDSAIKDEVPALKIGQKFQYADEKYQVIGTKETTADFTTGRKGLSYILKDLTRGYTSESPVWYVDERIKNGRYTLADNTNLKDTQYNKGDRVKAKLPSGHIDEFEVNRDLGSELEVIEKTNSGKVIKYTLRKDQIVDSAIKDSSDYVINYRNSYTRERNKETIKANSVIEAIKKFADAVALRGMGIANIDIISISPNDGYVRLYGSLQALLASKEFRDCNSIKDSNLSNAYVELKKYYPNAEVSMTNNTLIVSNLNELGSGIKSFLTNLNKKYGRPVSGFGGSPTNEPRITNNEALLFINDSDIKDSRTVLASKLKKGDIILDNKNKPYKITSIDYENGYVSLYADNLTEIGNARFTFDNDEKVELKDSAIKDYSVKHRGKQYIVRATSEKDAALKVMRKSK